MPSFQLQRRSQHNRSRLSIAFQGMSVDTDGSGRNDNRNRNRRRAFCSPASSLSLENIHLSLPINSLKRSLSFNAFQNDSGKSSCVDGTLTKKDYLSGTALYPGSKFKGIQKSGRTVYDVEVELLSMNTLEHSFSGYLTIAGLTEVYPLLTTFFEAEIIDGSKYTFHTRKWDANEAIDMEHWVCICDNNLN